MNDAHLHLVVNHFPIIGTILALGILLAGIIFKNNSVKNTAYFLFIIVALFALAAMTTGEGAEEMIEDIPNIGKQIIREHEELAAKLALVLYVLSGIAIAGLYLNYKKHSKANLVALLTLAVAILAVFITQKVGISGGEIRHTEIRNNNTIVTPENSVKVDVEK